METHDSPLKCFQSSLGAVTFHGAASHSECACGEVEMDPGHSQCQEILQVASICMHGQKGGRTYVQETGNSKGLLLGIMLITRVLEWPPSYE